MSNFKEIIIIAEFNFPRTNLTKTNMLFDPTDDMHEIEFWEERLVAESTPHLVAQITYKGRGKKTIRGYTIFTHAGQLPTGGYSVASKLRQA